MFKTRLFFIVFCLTAYSSFAQAQKQGSVKLPYVIEGDDTIPVVNLRTVNINDYGPDYLKNLQEYYRLRFNVIKVYPYAKLAAAKINEMNDQMKALPSDKERKKYSKEFEKQLREDFGKQVENLSVNQGKIFIKLLDRETGHTSYELIKDVKGSFNAFVFQTAAKLFGHDLKSGYNPQGEDKVIESIIKQIEAGEIN